MMGRWGRLWRPGAVQSPAGKPRLSDVQFSDARSTALSGSSLRGSLGAEFPASRVSKSNQASGPEAAGVRTVAFAALFH